ncbi:hypothetical protein SEA_DRE3_59 [Gordonia phage Dre3]|uniref:Uncharacterized protein n=1 Tax=Gordonia phage Gibbous TaxID=2652405 RepID=A0A5J6TA68_9CAUD|nr:hypothetical protein QLQ74_gp59 [Gordonia phage Gibbous]QFG05135.1 hypothetical protein SEA_GIBBOUS_59 [Gordonia phage Gibbous]QRI45988.1 hypothetical protein SEA_DRE3_59 [Gordonia phage Dre3]
MAEQRVHVQFQAWVDGQWQKVGSRTWLERSMIPPVGDQIIITRTVQRGTGPGGRDSDDFQYVVKERVWSLFGVQPGVIIVVEEATQ